MELLHRLIEALIPPPQGSRELAEAKAAYEPVRRQLTDKLDDDPCASDPSRRQCRDDPAQAIRRARLARDGEGR